MSAPGNAPPADSGVVILVPEAEPLVGAARAAWDRSASVGVPAHVTLLYPFVPARELDAGVVDRLRAALRGFVPFPFVLASTGRFDGVLFLAPEPATAFTALTTALVAAFPDYPPYGGVHEHLVPHLTVADRPDAPFDVLEEAVTPDRPITALARDVCIVARGEDDQWRVTTRLPLGESGEPSDAGAARDQGLQRRFARGTRRSTR